MTRRKRNPEAVSTEGGDYDRLKKAGFELRPPEDEYSYQPDSGSAMGGEVGSDEYGIRGGIASEEMHSHPEVPPASDVVTPDPHPVGSVDNDFPGTSEWSMEKSAMEEMPEEARPSREFDRPDAEIRELMEQRLDQHRQMHRLSDGIDVHVEVHEGTIELSGFVLRDAEKVLVEEIAEALPGVKDVDNHVEVRTTELHAH